MRFTWFAIAAVFISTSAQATVEDYCQAYAQDIADQVEKQSPRWQNRFNNAHESCLFRFSNTTETVVKPKPKTKTAIIKMPVESVEKPKPVVKPEVNPETQAAASVIPNLEQGSAEWKDYCQKKYVSFDANKGTYTSKTGVERKCLVTAE
jgi:BA14K-like protein